MRALYVKGLSILRAPADSAVRQEEGGGPAGWGVLCAGRTRFFVFSFAIEILLPPTKQIKIEVAKLFAVYTERAGMFNPTMFSYKFSLVWLQINWTFHFCLEPRVDFGVLWRLHLSWPQFASRNQVKPNLVLITPFYFISDYGLGEYLPLIGCRHLIKPVTGLQTSSTQTVCSTFKMNQPVSVSSHPLTVEINCMNKKQIAHLQQWGPSVPPLNTTDRIMWEIK